MLSLAAAALFFAALHLLVSGTSLRARLVRRWGEKTYLASFSTLSALGLVWLIVAFVQARAVLPTGLLEWRVLALPLNLIALVFICFGVLTKNPAGMGGGRYLGAAEPATALQRVTRHPMLWGITLWALTHMVFNPQPAPLLFFGAFAVVALCGTLSIDRKFGARHGAAWTRFAAVTSNLPFAAIAQGRNRLVWRELLGLPLWVALGLFAAFTLLHGALFGIPVIAA